MLFFLAQAAASSPASIPLHAAPLPIAPHPVPTTAGGGMLIVFLLLAAAYLFPSIRAWLGDHPKKWSVLVVNVLTGWTVIGYFVALKWSAPDKAPVAAVPAVSIPAGPRLIQEVQGLAPAPMVVTIPAPLPAAPAAPPVSSQDDVDKLAKLGALYEKGLLNAEEFQKAKAKIIF